MAMPPLGLDGPSRGQVESWSAVPCQVSSCEVTKFWNSLKFQRCESLNLYLVSLAVVVADRHERSAWQSHSTHSFDLTNDARPRSVLSTRALTGPRHGEVGDEGY